MKIEVAPVLVRCAISIAVVVGFLGIDRAATGHSGPTRVVKFARQPVFFEKRLSDLDGMTSGLGSNRRHVPVSLRFDKRGLPLRVLAKSLAVESGSITIVSGEKGLRIGPNGEVVEVGPHANTATRKILGRLQLSIVCAVAPDKIWKSTPVIVALSVEGLQGQINDFRNSVMIQIPMHPDGTDIVSDVVIESSSEFRGRLGDWAMPISK